MLGVGAGISVGSPVLRSSGGYPGVPSGMEGIGCGLAHTQGMTPSSPRPFKLSPWLSPLLLNSYSTVSSNLNIFQFFPLKVYQPGNSNFHCFYCSIFTVLEFAV